jgi:hypothetical protein
MKKLYRVSDDEVIAEFLKNEYFYPEYHSDREKYESIVMNPDLSNSAESAMRRQLLYRRRAHNWRELPLDTQWWVVELESMDLRKLRITPRGHWGKMTDHNFPSLEDIVDSIRQKRFPRSVDFDVSIIQSLCYRLRCESGVSSVLLIGLDEDHDLTILEGNHRLSAGLLADQGLIKSRFRVYAGLSMRMREYWLYESNVRNFGRHMLNRVRGMFGRDADLTFEPPVRAFPACMDGKAPDQAPITRTGTLPENG